MRRTLTQQVGMVLTWVSSSLIVEKTAEYVRTDLDFDGGQGGDAGGEVGDQDTGQMSEEEYLGQMREIEDFGQMGGGEDLGQMGRGENLGQMEDYGDSEDGWWIPSQIYLSY